MKARLLRCLSVFVLGVFAVGLTSPAAAQYIDENKELRDYTRSDFVTDKKPDWIGPYNWYYLPQSGYDIEVIQQDGITSPGDIPNDHPKHPSNLPRYTCVITNDKVGHPNFDIFADPYNHNGGSMRCKPRIGDAIAEKGDPDLDEDRYAHMQVGSEIYESQGFAYEKIGSSYVNSRKGGGYGQVVFTWNWEKRTVHKKLCDSARVSNMSQQDLIEQEGKYTSIDQQQLVDSERVKASDLNVEVNVCTDDPMKEEPNKPQPYDTFKEQEVAITKCRKNVIKDFDQGHSTRGAYSRWKDEVEKGWFRGMNEGFSKDRFMEFCLEGGEDPFSPDPFPGIEEGSFSRNKAYGDTGGDYNSGDTEINSASPEEIWSMVDDYAGTGQLEDRRRWAVRKCNRLYDEIMGRRKAAFQELCKKEPYAHWKNGPNGKSCSQRMKECKGYRNDNGIDVGVQECCTDEQPEYHYYNYKTFEIPCKPIDMFKWEGGGASSAAWTTHDPDDISTGGFLGIGGESRDGPLGDFGGSGVGLNGIVQIIDGDRGFVGRNGWLSFVGGDGEAMDVRANGYNKIGSYFWFDLKFGTIGMHSFEEPKDVQTVRLPGRVGDAGGSFWEAGNTIRGSGGGIASTADDISDQRGQTTRGASFNPFASNDGEQKGYLYHLYFCEKSFTDEEVKLMRRKWKTPESRLNRAKNNICPEGEVYEYDERADNFQCMPKERFDGYAGGTPKVKYCAQCQGHDPEDPKKRTSFSRIGRGGGGIERFHDHSTLEWCPEEHYVAYDETTPPQTDRRNWLSEEESIELPVDKKNYTLGDGKKCEYVTKGSGPPNRRAWLRESEVTRFCASCSDLKEGDPEDPTVPDYGTYCPSGAYDGWSEVSLGTDVDDPPSDKPDCDAPGRLKAPCCYSKDGCEADRTDTRCVYREDSRFGFGAQPPRNRAWSDEDGDY